MTGRRLAWVTVLVAALATLGVLVGTSLQSGLVYYRTPTELGTSADAGLVRVGGLVVVGSADEGAGSSSLVLTDGVTDVAVRYAGPLPDVLHEGEGAVVEGTVAADGALEAERILLRHSNEYRAPEEGS